MCGEMMVLYILRHSDPVDGFVSHKSLHKLNMNCVGAAKLKQLPRARLEYARLHVVRGAQRFRVQTEAQLTGQHDFRYAANDAGRIAPPRVVQNVGHAAWIVRQREWQMFERCEGEGR